MKPSIIRVTTSRKRLEGPKRTQQTSVLAAACALTLHFWVATAFFLVSGVILTGQGIPIEKAQRDFQSRYYLLRGTYVKWLGCGCGPAPQFPTNGFYGDLSKNPQLAKELVYDLAEKFFYTKRILDEFIDTPDGVTNVEGRSDWPPHFDSDKMPDITLSGITELNYPAHFNTIRSHLDKLKYLQEDAWITGIDENHTTEYKQNSHYTGDYDNCDSLDMVKSRTVSDWNTSEWTTTDLNSPWPMSSLQELWERENSDPPPSYGAYLESVQGRIEADLTSYTGGPNRGRIFIKLSPADKGCLPENHPPLSSNKVNNLFWFCQFTSLGSIYRSPCMGDVKSDFPPNPYPYDPYSRQTTGWTLEDQFVIVEPLFDPNPDEVKCGECLCKFGTVTTKLGSLHFSISLGRTKDGKSAGLLFVQEEKPSSSLFTPARVRWTAAEEVTVSTDGNGWLQTTYAPQGRIELNVLSGSSYKFIIIGNDESTLKNVIVSQNGSENKLRLNEIEGSSSWITDFNYDPETSQWEMIEGNPSSDYRKTSKITDWDEQHLNRTDTIRIKDQNDQVVAEQIEKYKVFNWGQELVQTITGTGNSALTNQWFFYDQAGDGDNYGRVKLMIEPAGRWERYKYDQYGRTTNVVSQFGNNATNSADSSNRALSTIYSSDNSVVTNIEKVLAQEISRSYTVFDQDERGYPRTTLIRCAVPVASMDNTSNERTVITFLPSTSPPKVECIINPDGTRQIYSESDGSYTDEYRTDPNAHFWVVESGQYDQNQAKIINGTKTQTVRGVHGEVYPLVA